MNEGFSCGMQVTDFSRSNAREVAAAVVVDDSNGGCGSRDWKLCLYAG
jgi:hypothetical protein